MTQMMKLRDFYELLSKIYNDCPTYDIKVVLRDMNAKVGKEECFRPTIGKCSMHENTNYLVRVLLKGIPFRIQV
jgi:hypothetical protein